MREKMRQPTMSKILLHFWTFQRGYKNQSSNIFWKIIKKSHFYVVKFFNVQNVPHFWLFTQCAKVLSKCARGGTKCAIFAQLRKIWQHCCACAEEKNKMMKMLRLCLCSPLSIPRIKEERGSVAGLAGLRQTIKNTKRTSSSLLSQFSSKFPMRYFFPFIRRINSCNLAPKGRASKLET